MGLKMDFGHNLAYLHIHLNVNSSYEQTKYLHLKMIVRLHLLLSYRAPVSFMLAHCLIFILYLQLSGTQIRLIGNTFIVAFPVKKQAEWRHFPPTGAWAYDICTSAWLLVEIQKTAVGD